MPNSNQQNPQPSSNLMDPEEYQAWRSHPSTAKFLGFLADYANQLTAQWRNGKFQRDIPDVYVSVTNDALARVQVYDDICALSYEDMAALYASPEEVPDDNEDEEEL